MSEKDFIEINKILDVEIPSFDDDFELEDVEPVIKPKKFKIDCSEAQYLFLKNLSEFTEIEEIITSLCLVSSYYQILYEEGKIKNDLLSIAKQKIKEVL
jgi:hypothetical protein